MTLAQETCQNHDPGRIGSRKFYWSGAVGSDIPLAKGGHYPREITVFHAGDLSVTYDDGETEVIVGIEAGHVFNDKCWAQINATSSTAYNIYVGW